MPAQFDYSITPQPVSAERAARQRALSDWHAEWTDAQLSAGVDAPVPADQPVVSDWNLHVPDLRASAKAEDEFHRRAREIMGIT